MLAHTPVLVKEVIWLLDVSPGKRYIDATLGGGGHTEAILTNGGKVLGIDQDPKSLELAKERVKQSLPLRGKNLSLPSSLFKPVHGNFSKIGEIARAHDFGRVAGIVMDLGFSNFQLTDPKRGLSISGDDPLDMRLDPSLAVSAADLVNSLPETQLAKLFWEVGQERLARGVAKRIVLARKKQPFSTTRELADLVSKVYREHGIYELRPAVKVFMCLRIAVNSEFENLRQGLSQAAELLAKGGRIVVISFHSGEDRIVKNFFREMSAKGTFRILTKKPVVPSEAEVRSNPQSASAKCRSAEKI